jgi:transposase-like protein
MPGLLLLCVSRRGRDGHSIDFLLTAQRDKEAMIRFLKKASRWNGVPETITVGGSEATVGAIKSYHEEHGTTYIERFKNTLRQRVSRLVCEALSFSKKLFLCHSNLTRAAA